MTSHKRRSLTMKQAREKIRPKSKGKKKAKMGDKNNQNLPLLNKLIYIDIKQGKQCELIEEQLKKLGARVEKFLSCEINYVISLTGSLKTEKINAKDDNPQSPSFVNMTSPFNCGPSPTGNNEIKKAVVSRGKALAQIACAKNQASSVVANAEKLGIKIISLDAASKWLEKELKKLNREYQNDACKNEDKTCPFNSQTHESKKRKKQLKGPFIKFEAVNKLYRPVKSEFPTWPKINLLAPPGISPFGEARLKVQHHFRARKCLPSETVSGNGMDTAEHKAQEIRTPKNVKASAAFPELVGVPIVTAGEVKGNLAVHFKKATQINKQQGYCDCCEIKYNNLDEHLTSYEHRTFVRDKSNFESLDALINKVPSTVQFLQSVLLKHCAQKQDVDESSENSVGNFLSVVSPISPLTTTEMVPSLETVPTSLLVPQELKDENLPSKNKLTADGIESDTKTKTQNDDHLSAVVIRRPTPSGIFTSPRRRQPTPSKKPWVQERSMVFRDSPMASLQPSIKSSPNFTLAESVCLAGTRCFSAPALNKKQELRKSASRSLIRVIDFTQMANLGGDTTEQSIELPSVQYKHLSAGEVKKKLIGNNVCFKQNKRKSHKLKQKENETVRFHEDIQNFNFLTLSTDEKVTIEMEGHANNNSFSSEHFKDTTAREAKANNSSSSEQFKITERNANTSEYFENTIVKEANANNNSFSSKDFKNTIVREAITKNNSSCSEYDENTSIREANANNNSSSEHFKNTIVKEGNDQISHSSEHFKKSDEMETNANNIFSSQHLKESPERKANDNSFSSEHLKVTIERQANAPFEHINITTNSVLNASKKVKCSTQTKVETQETKDNLLVKKQNTVFKISCELVNDVDVLEENLSDEITLSKQKKSKRSQLTLSEKNNSILGCRDLVTERSRNKSVGSESIAETEKNNSILGCRDLVTERTRNKSVGSESIAETEKNNSILGCRDLVTERTRNKSVGSESIAETEKNNSILGCRDLVTERTRNKSVGSESITETKKNNSLLGCRDLVTERTRNKSVGSKYIAETSSLISCRTNLESDNEITSHSANKTSDLFSQNGKDCEVQTTEGDCLNSTPQKKNYDCNKKAKVICPLKQVCNISSMKFNCVVNLGAELKKNVFNVTYQNESKVNLPSTSTNKEIQKESHIRIEDEGYIPIPKSIPENCVEKLSEEEMSCDYFGHQDDCELNDPSISVPNIADRVKTRQRVGQLIEQCEDEAEHSSLTVQDKKKKMRERKLKSLNKTIENIGNDNLAYSDSNNTLKTSKQPTDLALPAFPNIAERVKKRRSCTLFNHEGQYANSGLNNSGVILSPEMLRLQTNYTQKNNQKMVSISSNKHSFRRKLIFSGSKSTVNVDEESKMSSDCTQSSPAVVIRRRNPLSCRVRTNKDWSKHETDKEHSDNQSSSDSDNNNDSLRDGCDKNANLAPRSKNLSVKCLKKAIANLSNESTNKRDQIVASENSLKMNPISNSPRLVLKIKRQTKNTFSSTFEEIDCSNSLYSQLNQAGSSQRPETPQPSNRAKCLDSDSESIKFNCSPTPRKQIIYSSPNCNSPSLNTLHEKPRRFKKRKRLHFEELSESSFTSLERPKSPIFSSPAVKNSSLASNEKQNYLTRVDSPIFYKKQSSKQFFNRIDELNVNLKADLEVKTIIEDLKDDDNNLEYAQFEEFSSDATYIYDADVFQSNQIEQFDGQIMLKSSHEIAGYNDYKDYLTFIPKQNSPEKTDVSSWGDICESYINNSIVMTVANNGVGVNKDTFAMSPCTINNVNKPVMSGKRGKKRLSEVNCLDKMDESCRKKIKI